MNQVANIDWRFIVGLITGLLVSLGIVSTFIIGIVLAGNNDVDEEELKGDSNANSNQN